MYNIEIRGVSGEVSGTNNLKLLNHIGCDEEFSEYFGDEEVLLVQKGVTNGFMHFEYRNNNEVEILETVVNYESKEELTEDELDVLMDYTSGQLSDGIGEGFEQMPCTYDEDDNEIYVSPWCFGQTLTIKQTKYE